MKINIISILAPLASAALLSGCAKTASPERIWTTDPDAVRIEASVGTLTKTYPAGTEEEQKKFKGPEGTKYPGDQIAVSVEANGQAEKTVTYEFDAEVWNPVPATDYLVWKAPVTYKAWYPASAKDGFTLPTDQSGSLTENHGNFERADFMIGEYACASKDKIPSDHKLKLVMNRKMALVTVNVDKNRLKNQFEGKDIYMIRVESIQSGLSQVSSDGAGSGNPVDVRPYMYDSAYTSDGNYHAIVVPCDGNASARFLKITVRWKPGYDEDKAELYVTGRPKFEAGKRYTYNLTVGKDKLDLGDITVSEWGDPVDLNGDGGEYDADKLSDPINMTELRAQLKAWNEANQGNQKQLKDLITTELLNENCKKGKLIITGEFDNTTPAYTDTEFRKCYGMSEETLEAFEKIAEYARTNKDKVSYLDLSGLKGLTAIGEIPKKNGSTPYYLNFENCRLVTFIGSPDIVAFGSAGSCFWNNWNLVSVSGLENVTYADDAFQNCSGLTEVPNMPNATSFKYTFDGTAIKELRHDNVKILAVSNCNELTVIDCPKVNYLISKAFSSPLPKLTELRLTSDFFEKVHVDAFDGVVKANCSLWLNANQEGNIDKTNNLYAWTPKKSDQSTSAVDNSGGGNQDKTSISLEGFKAIYCEDTQIK